MSKERRRFDRLPVSVDVEITDLDTFETEDAVLLNVGPSGAFVTSRVLFPKNGRLVLDFQLEQGGAAISLVARVLWHRTGLDGAPHGFGCQFEQVSKKDQAAIHEFALGQRTHGREFVL
ncbi:MAG: PilZ domain-containing protein [Planctomycetota bacterium]